MYICTSGEMLWCWYPAVIALMCSVILALVSVWSFLLQGFYLGWSASPDQGPPSSYVPPFCAYFDFPQMKKVWGAPLKWLKNIEQQFLVAERKKFQEKCPFWNNLLGCKEANFFFHLRKPDCAKMTVYDGGRGGGCVRELSARGVAWNGNEGGN